jgi:hypothetical protein
MSPSVHLDEQPSNVRRLVGTSTTAFVGYTATNVTKNAAPPDVVTRTSCEPLTVGAAGRAATRRDR